MSKKIVVTDTGVAGHVAARILQARGQHVTIMGCPEIHPPAVDILFRGTLLGKTSITGVESADGAAFGALEYGANGRLASYCSGLLNETSSRFSLRKTPSINAHTHAHFASQELRKVVQFPYIFLGLNTLTESSRTAIEVSVSERPTHTLALVANTKNHQLNPHTVIISKDWDKNHRLLFHEKRWSADPTYYVGALSDTELQIEVPLPNNTNYTATEYDQYSDWIIELTVQTLHLADLTRKT